MGEKVCLRCRGKILLGIVNKLLRTKSPLTSLGWFKNPLSSQTEKLMAGTKFSDYLGLNHYKKAKKLKYFIHLGLAQGPQSFATYRSISPSGNLGNQLKNHV